MAPNADGGGRTRRTGTSDPRRGIVLLDVVLAMAVLAMVAALVWPMMRPSTSPSRQRAYAEEIATLMRADRLAARRIGSPVATRIDLARRVVVSGARGRTLRLPRDVDLEAVSTAACGRDGDVVEVRFAADGRSCGLRLALSTGSRRQSIEVDWLTGAVDVTGGRRD